MSKQTVNKPYSGKDPYIFVSYSHRNLKKAKDILKQLQIDKYRVWYDEGIDPGTEWDENIASHIDGCSYFIALISKDYLVSTNCKDELNYARELDKPRLLIYLENVELPSGMRMRLSRLQAIHMYTYTDSDLFFEKMKEAKGITVCRDKNANRQEAKEHLIFVIDSSASMYGERIDGINAGLNKFNTYLAEADRNEDDLEVVVFHFNSGITMCRLEDCDPIVAEGGTLFGDALGCLWGYGNNIPKDSRCAIILVLDGWPLDSYEEFIIRLKREKWFSNAYKVGIAVGEAVDIDALRGFTGSAESVTVIEDREMSNLADLIYESGLKALETISGEQSQKND